MINSITLLGSSSGRNAGDAALMSSIMDSVDKEFGRKLLYEIPTIKPDFVKREYTQNTKAIPILPWNLSVKMLGLPTYQSVMRTDLSLIFDAVLFDRALYNPLFNFLSSFYLILPRAKRKGKKLGCYNCGLGPVTSNAGRKMLRELLEQMDFITVRDEGSYRVLQDLGVKNPRTLLTADAALNAPSIPDSRVEQILGTVGLKLSDEILGININCYLDSWAGTSRTPLSKEHFLSIYSDALNRFLEKNSVPVLFVCTQHNDIEITKELMSKIRSKERLAIIDNKSLTHIETKGVMRALSLLFAMRLHATILASSELAPIAGLAYQPKVKFYFDMLGIGNHCHSFDKFDANYLHDAIDSAWTSRAAIGRTLQQRIPELQERAKLAAKLVMALHKGDDLDRTIVQLKGGAGSAEDSRRAAGGLS